MSKEFKVSKEFILDAYDQACSEWRQRLQDNFPEAFEVDANQWLYTTDKKGNEYLWFYEGKETTKTEGFFRGEYRNEDTPWHTGLQFARECVPAKEEDIKRIFLAELVKRGYDGSYIDVLNEGKASSKTIDLSRDITLCLNARGLEIVAYSDFGGYTIYKNGKWMKKIEVLTKKQVEDKYSIKIIG